MVYGEDGEMVNDDDNDVWCMVRMARWLMTVMYGVW